MPSARDLQRQINTVKNQARVFSALQTVSSVKFRKAEARVKRARPYAENVEQMMRDVAANATGDLPLLTGREVNRVAVCTLTADRGLAGGFNAQVLRRTSASRRERSRCAAGRERPQGRCVLPLQARRARRGLHRFHGQPDLRERARSDAPSPVSSTTRRRTSLPRLQPLRERPEPEARRQAPPTCSPGGDDEEGNGTSYMEYVPDAETVLKRLVPRYVETMVWQALLEGAAGEHGARMTAMKNATDNANDLVSDLTLQMNKARQAQITQEILEIVGGAEALSAG